MTRKLGILASLGLCLLLPACGGNSGGGSDSGAAGSGSSTAASSSTPPVINGITEGAWSGSTSKSEAVDFLLLENGRFYAMFRADIAGVAPDLAFIQGSYTFNKNQFAASGNQFNAKGPDTGSLDGSLVDAPSNASLAGNAINSGGRVTGTYAVKPTSTIDKNYSYNRPADVTDIEGAWSSAYFLGETSSYYFSIAPKTGEVSASNPVCAIKGSFTPRSSNKNVFGVSLQFGASPCTHADMAFSGVALSYVAANKKQQLTAALLDDKTKTTAIMLFAQR